MKKLFIIFGGLLLTVTSCSAGYTGIDIHLSPNNVLTYPNEGWVRLYSCYDGDNSDHQYSSHDYHTDGHTMHVNYTGSAYTYLNHSEDPPCSTANSAHKCRTYTGSHANAFNNVLTSTGHSSGSNAIVSSASGNSNKIFMSMQASIGSGRCWNDFAYSSGIFYISLTGNNLFNVYGDICGITWVKQYIYDDFDYLELENITGLDVSGDSYSFIINNQSTYKLVFSNGNEHIFICDSKDEIYHYDVCDYYTINLFDDCANPLINPYTTIYRNAFIPFLLYQGYDNPINLNIGTDIELGDNIDITVHTCDGDVMLHDGCVEERIINMFHQDISWDLDITCEDDNTGEKLQGVNIIRTQDCCIIGNPSGYALTQANGKVCFTGLANSNIAVTATKGGYADYSNTISVGNSFDCQTQGRAFTIYMNATSAGGNSTDDYNNGTHNDSENVDGTDEETLPSEHGFGCGVYFKNIDGYIVSSIYDTDAYVDMYWWVKNHDDGCSNLKFQYQTYTHWYTSQAYTVSNNTYEYRRIYNADFNDHTNSYRGYIYNETEGCNDIQTLKVLNHTYHNESNYRNLTSHCHFEHKLGGNQIDYRSNVKIKIYANSDNSTLLTITANFMNGSTLEDSITYNWADFTNANSKWWVIWEPDYEYTSGYNYTVNITGFDGYQLDTDEVWTTDIVGSELTVFVKDNYNQQVTHSTVFIEGWGSISTGDKNYVSIAGFAQGTYQYKATKSGYISSGWASIDMDSHESVTCILVSETQTSITASKMTNAEIKAFFIPLMYLLLIMILLGAFKFACGGK